MMGNNENLGSEESQGKFYKEKKGRRKRM